jgi:hypothetical protein
MSAAPTPRAASPAREAAGDDEDDEDEVDAARARLDKRADRRTARRLLRAGTVNQTPDEVLALRLLQLWEAIVRNLPCEADGSDQGASDADEDEDYDDSIVATGVATAEELRSERLIFETTPDVLRELEVATRKLVSSPVLHTLRMSTSSKWHPEITLMLAAASSYRVRALHGQSVGCGGASGDRGARGKALKRKRGPRSSAFVTCCQACRQEESSNMYALDLCGPPVDGIGMLSEPATMALTFRDYWCDYLKNFQLPQQLSARGLHANDLGTMYLGETCMRLAVAYHEAAHFMSSWLFEMRMEIERKEAEMPRGTLLHPKVYYLATREEARGLLSVVRDMLCSSANARPRARALELNASDVDDESFWGVIFRRRSRASGGDEHAEHALLLARTIAAANELLPADSECASRSFNPKGFETVMNRDGSEDEACDGSGGGSGGSDASFVVGDEEEEEEEEEEEDEDEEDEVDEEEQEDIRRRRGSGRTSATKATEDIRKGLNDRWRALRSRASSDAGPRGRPTAVPARGSIARPRGSAASSLLNRTPVHASVEAEQDSELEFDDETFVAQEPARGGSRPLSGPLSSSIKRSVAAAVAEAEKQRREAADCATSAADAEDVASLLKVCEETHRRIKNPEQKRWISEFMLSAPGPAQGAPGKRAKAAPR